MASSFQSSNVEIQVEYSSLFGEDAVDLLVKNRQEEFDILKDLNGKFDTYLNSIGDLDSQNRALERLIAELQEQVAKFRRNSDDTHKKVQDAAKEKAALEATLRGLKTELEICRERLNGLPDKKGPVDDVVRKIDDIKRKLDTLRRTVNKLEDQLKALKDENANLINKLTTAKTNLTRAYVNNFEAETELGLLPKRIELLRRVHKLEEERNNFIIQQGDHKNLLANAVKQIRDEFGDLADRNRQYLVYLFNKKMEKVRHTQYNRYKQELEFLGVELEAMTHHLHDLDNKNKKLKDKKAKLEQQKAEDTMQLRNLETKLEELLAKTNEMQNDLQKLFDRKQMLFAELAIYRKLLGVERNQPFTVAPGRPTDIDVSSFSSATTVAAPTVTPSTTRRMSTGGEQTTYGSTIRFKRIAGDGSYIDVENTTNEPVPLDRWKITRVVDNREPGLEHVIQSRIILRPGEFARIWANGQQEKYERQYGRYGDWNFAGNLEFTGASNWGVCERESRSILFQYQSGDYKRKAIYTEKRYTDQEVL